MDSYWCSTSYNFYLIASGDAIVTICFATGVALETSFWFATGVASITTTSWFASGVAFVTTTILWVFLNRVYFGYDRVIEFI